jgi:voltage-gated potassium channel
MAAQRGNRLMALMRRRGAATWRQRIYEILEEGEIGDPVGGLVNKFIVALILLNLAVVVLQSEPELDHAYGFWFNLIEFVSLFAFTVEYGLRLWVAVEDPLHRHRGAMAARVKFATSMQGIIDLLAVLPFWFTLVLPSALRSFIVFRIVRLLKLARHSSSVRSLFEAIHSERRALFGCLAILGGLTLFVAAIMHVAEADAQPDKFGTIPEAMWWAIVTLGTVGYGDVVPVTPFGKVVAGFTIIGGLMMVALPVGIIATAFAREIHRRDFVVTWSMVARVPLFVELSASEIAHIMPLLRAQIVAPGAIIVRRGEPAHSMYFIAAGDVEIELPDERVRLSGGQFFGEIAVLRKARRSATVTALSRTSLLLLEAHDFRMLMDGEPRIAKRVQDMVRDRLGRDLVGAKGDIISEEIEQGEIEEVSDRPRPDDIG